MDMEKDKMNLVLGLLRTAYNDYIAARVLLNRDYTLQGVILASTAIEKYLKTVIAMQTGKVSYVHMDRFDVLKAEFMRTEYGILFDLVDKQFLNILTKGYRYRYYNNIKEPTTLGFFKNQFLGELDGMIELLERLFILKKVKEGKEVPILSPLKMDYQVNKNPDLSENNWVTTKEKNKKSFMENNCIGFAVYLRPDNIFEEIQVSSKPMKIPYDGAMTLITVNEQGKPDLKELQV